MANCDPTEQGRRQAYLDWLYARSGRTCSTYSGLYQQRAAELMEQDARTFELLRGS